MGLILSLLPIFFSINTVAIAGELDNERGVTNKDNMHGTLILRVDKRTNKAEYVATEKPLATKETAKKFSRTAKYKNVPSGKMRNELDHSSGTSSWYFYNGYNGYNQGYGPGGYNDNGYYSGNYNYYNPFCNYYGQRYQPYYYNNYGPYNYYYYGNCNWGWNNCYRY